MSITFACACGAKLQAKDDKAGTSLPCPKCGETVMVPNGTALGDETANVPVLKRKAYSEPTNAMPISAAVESHEQQPYQACRVMCGVFVFSGYASLLLAVVFACLAGWITTQLGEIKSVNASQAITLGTTSLVFGVMGFFQFASAELLGGAVAFLLKHDCKP